MKKLIVGGLVFLLVITTACSSQKKAEPEDDFAVEATNNESLDSGTSEKAQDDLSLDGLDEKTDKAEDDLSLDSQSATNATAESDELDLEKELNNVDSNGQPKAEKAAANDDLSLDDQPTDTAQTPPPETSPEPSLEDQLAANGAQTDTPPASPEEAPPAIVDTTGTQAAVPTETALPVEAPVEAPVAEVPPETTEAPLANISAVNYKSNGNGGSLAISADQPLEFKTRLNSATNQLVIEVENSVIPKKLKRSLNTKDMASSIASVDIYQKKDSSVARFVVQLRDGAAEPLVQKEGNTLLIIGAANPNAPVEPETAKVEAEAPAEAAGGVKSEVVAGDAAKAEPPVESGLLSFENLEDFLASNNKFYGKKISFQSGDMDIKDFIRFLSEETGVNIIMDEGLSGKVTVKFKEIPWDQALVLVLKSKKLAFRRMGSVLRIGKLDDMIKEESDAINLVEKKKANVPLTVRRFFIGYADLTDLSTKISDFLTAVNTAANAGDKSAPAPKPPSKVISDKRTNSIIVTDTEDNMAKIARLIEAIDTQPQQVLIEGKVVEAKQSFASGLGIQWSTSNPTGVNQGRIGIKPVPDIGTTVLDAGFSWGQLDVVGNLSAALQLGEQQKRARVLSSPRVTVLSSEAAVISQTTDIQVTKSVTTTTTGVQTTSETKQVGITLKVTPQASNEGTVSMKLDITRSFQGQDGTDARAAQTQVIVKSGQTAVIGGIYESSTEERDSGVPGLRSVPILGSLFQNENVTKSKSELIIFVTPTILKPLVGDAKKVSEIK